jgi:hypothetical protein
MECDPAAAGGSLMFGPDADAEGLVLDLLNRQDRYVAVLPCQVRRDHSSQHRQRRTAWM